MIVWLKKQWSMSIRHQLIISIALLFGLISTVFVGVLVNRQERFLDRQIEQHSVGLAKILAANSVTWVVTHDFIGLEEVINSLKYQHDLRYVMVIDTEGKIMGHINHDKVGQYFTDAISLGLLSASKETHILVQTPRIIDIAEPILYEGQMLGWARLSLSKEEKIQGVKDVINNGLVYIFIAIILGILLAYVFAENLTRRLYNLLHLSEETSLGRKDLRADTGSIDEIGQLALGFNHMLDSLVEEEKKLNKAHEDLSSLNVELEKRVADRTEALSIKNKELNITKEEAESANKAKSIFLANMSHELRTPLTAILGFTYILRNASDTTTEQMEKLNIVSNSGENLLDLINNILDISKIEAGHIKREDSETNLKQLIIEIESLMFLKIKEKGLGFNIKLAADLPEDIMVDSAKLRQVLINLIANAVKYTEKGEVSLSINALENKSADRIRLRFEVQDLGSGIKEKDKKIIFSSFHQVGNQPLLESGTGLGLAICEQFVKLMDGQIAVESEVGNGSLFYFDIQAGTVSTLEKKFYEGLHRRVKCLAEGEKHYNILIAEDKPENRLLLRNILEPAGFKIREAVNGQEAVDIFEQWRPQLIFMDIRMPVMNGLQATRYIKKTKGGTETKIVALTAHAFDEDRLEIFQAGCDEIVRKPYHETDIFNSLGKQLKVKFLYEDENLSNQDIKKYKINEEDFKKIPAVLIKKLQEATVLLDNKKCLKLAEKISAYNNDMSATFTLMIKDLKYKEILSLLDKVIQG